MNLPFRPTQAGGLALILAALALKILADREITITIRRAD